MKRLNRWTAAAMGAVLALSLAACSNPNTSDGGSTSGSSNSTKSNRPIKIGFFGFAKANTFAQATYAGIEEYAKKNNASATFVDSNFSGPDQVSALQDAVTSKRYDVAIIQANDGTALVNPVKQAIAAGMTVVVEFTPIGGKYDTAEAQVPGTLNIIDPPTVNGAGLATLGLDACKEVASGTCKVGYLQGFDNYPLDTARTKAAVSVLERGGAEVYSNFVGGYTADSGRTAMQNLLQAHPDVDVVIGSSQAVAGATPLAKGMDITFVGNGGSTQAFDHVKAGTWFGVYALPEKAEGSKAAELGIGAARGKSVEKSLVACATLTKVDCLGTKSTLPQLTADYSD